MTFEEKKLEEFDENFKSLAHWVEQRGWVGTKQGIKDFLSQALKEQREVIDENWKYKIQQVIKKISGSEYEEKQVWREFIKLIQEI